MMSCYLGGFATSTSYMLHLNSCGDAVLYPIDASGKPSGEFASGKIGDVIGGTLKKHGFRVTEIAEKARVATRFNFPSWKEFCNALNKKRGVRRAVARAFLDMLDDCGEFFDFDGEQWQLTQRAKAADKADGVEEQKGT